MALWRLLVSILIGYLLGNFQTGIFVGKVLKKTDIRQHGSGGTGATNALRTFGPKAGIITLVGDCLKGVAASLIGLAIGGPTGQLLAALFVVVGHIWPALFRFKGGKGVMTSVGALIVIHPLIMLCIIVISLSVIAATRFVSLGNIVAGMAYGVLAAGCAIYHRDAVDCVVSVLIAFLVVYAHRENIRRLLNGTERKLSFKKS